MKNRLKPLLVTIIICIILYVSYVSIRNNWLEQQSVNNKITEFTIESNDL